MDATSVAVTGAGVGVLLLAVALAVFNSAMVRSKHAIGMLMYGIGAIGVCSVTWATIGFSLAFQDIDRAIGGTRHAGLTNLDGSVLPFAGASPLSVAFLTLGAVSVAAVALTGAAADRMRFGPMLAFLALWSVLVPPAVLRWTLPGGWMAEWGARGEAGGAMLGVAVGASAFGLVLVLGPRNKWRKRRVVPHSRPLAIAGALVTWVGWLALIGGFALAAGASMDAVMVAHFGAVGGLGGWILVDRRLHIKVTSVGAVSGAVTGLVAVTPGAGSLDFFRAMVVGFVAAIVAAVAIRIKYRLGYDDALDVVAVHLWGGAVGMLLVGVVAKVTAGAPGGLVAGDGGELLARQAAAVGVIAVFAFVVTVIVAWIVRATMGLRVSPEDESIGLDEAQHGESAYEIGH